jgi:putative ABC transport system permease protein
MDFDVSGVPFQGVIGSVRKVRWSSFEPNFMILVQPGALDDAPKVWVASASGMSVTQINKAQTELVKTHPNITMVDLKDAVRRFLLFIDQSGSAISVVAWIALIGALGVLFAISYSRVSSRVKFTAILRAVGGSSGDARVVILIEYFIIALTAVVCGTLLGFVSGGLIVVYGLKAPWTISLAAETLYSLAVLPAAVILAWISTLRVTKTSVLSLLGR